MGVLLNYNESKSIVYSAIRRYITAMAERENAGITKIDQSNTQSEVNSYTSELIPRDIIYVTLDQEAPASIVSNSVYDIIPDDTKLNKFKFILKNGEKYSATIPTEAFESFSDVEYDSYIRKLYDEKLLTRAQALRSREEETIKKALEAKMSSFNDLIRNLNDKIN